MKRGLGPVQLFTLAFGTIAGIAWVFLTGPWLAAAGSIGTALAIGVGAVIMLPIVVTYAALARRIPGAGGEILYAGVAVGERTALMAGWILAACYISLVAFIVLTVAWLVDVGLANLARQFHTPLDGTQELGVLVSAATFVVVIVANHRGVRGAARLQDAIIALKLLAVFALAALSLSLGDPANLRPYFPDSVPAFASGFTTVLVTAPFLYAGFNTAVQAMADVDAARVGRVRRAFLAAVLCAAAFYVVIVLSIAIALPRPALLAEELPALSGLAAALDTPLATAFVAVIALLALAGCWNGVFLAGGQVLAELSRRGLLPRWVAATSRPDRAPMGALAIMVVGALALAALGRDAVELTVGTVSFFMALAFAIACHSLWRLPRDPAAPYEHAMAAIGGVLAVGLIALAAVEMLRNAGSSPQWLLIVGWLGAGALLQRRHHAPAME